MFALRLRAFLSTRLPVPLILASSSSIRRDMLRAAGVEFEIVPSSVDESAAKARFSTANDIAGELGAAKALAVSRARPGDWVIGSDSVISVAGRIFDKPRDRDEAVDHLRFFSGKPMTLTSAVALAKGGELDWQLVDTATLQVRPLSEAFIAVYLDAEWPEVGHTVGVFRLEARGVQLFSAIDGDHFTILGMPLIPLLGALRERELLVA
jgi:septum formation protein